MLTDFFTIAFKNPEELPIKDSDRLHHAVLRPSQPPIPAFSPLDRQREPPTIMQQTILTLGALMIITMTSVNQQRSNYMIIEDAYVREIENAAYDYAMMRMENIVNSTAFDESIADVADAEVDISLLTTTGNFGTDDGEYALANFDDLDDFHGYEETVRHGLSTDTFNFAVSYEVRYINPSNPSATTTAATRAKELTVNVVSQDTVGHKVAQFSGAKITIADDNL